jgi:site-specific recombinase XerD
MSTGQSELDHRFTTVVKVWKENRCLKPSSINVYRLWVQRFTVYCNKKKLDETAQLTLAGVFKFSQWYARSHHLDPNVTFSRARSALQTWAIALQTLGEAISPWTTARKSLQLRTPLLREFANHLRLDRGNPEVTIHKKVRHIILFKVFLSKRSRRLQQLRLEDIDAFVIACRKRYARTTTADMCSSLRGFVRFLHMSGRLPVDLASSILAPIVRRDERPHRALPWEDVQRILHAVDRHSPCGKRDYALLLMMSAYGLGAGEVIQLTLEDISWKAATLHVTRPKTGAEFLLPLLFPVARALSDYLLHGRPVHAQTRHLFVTMKAPYKPLASSVTIRHILHTHAQRAGVTAAYLGTHVLRHTHACRQMELGTQPKLIGDILGHRDPESTSAYLRVATERLRHLALPVPSP